MIFISFQLKKKKILLHFFNIFFGKDGMVYFPKSLYEKGLKWQH